MVKYSFATFLCMVMSASAFIAPQNSMRVHTAFKMSTEGLDKIMSGEVSRGVDYQPGQADTEFARRFGHLAGRKVRTCGEATKAFHNLLDNPVNPLYRGYVTDLVGLTHLCIVDARFVKDPIWSAGLIYSLDLLLGNYPEPTAAQNIRNSLFSALDLDQEECTSEAKALEEWAAGKTMDEVTAAFQGEGDSIIAKVVNDAKANDFWKYSQFFGLGLVRIMELIGVEKSITAYYPIVEKWVKESMGKPEGKAKMDADEFLDLQNKVEMMETMMKEIAIREKKRMAERLESKAKAALGKAQQDAEFAAKVKEAEEKLKAEKSS